MKVFWNKKNLWSKAKNIVILNQNNISIPNTIIIESNNKKIDFKNLEIQLKKNIKYILRPSFKIEDWNSKSYAWFFNSIFPIEKNKIINILNSKNLNEIFNWKWFNLKSIIIQEFIEAESYWVYFTRSPDNIFTKGLYEVWNNNNEITSWKEKKPNTKLSFLSKIDLENIWNKLEKLFNAPQDIEFCIKNWEIIILQTRPITTWNNTTYNFSEILKINWVYKTLDFDEIWEYQDNFSYDILKRLFNCIYIWNKIYFKSYLLPHHLFKNINTNNKNLDMFYKKYKIYLIKKFYYW
jgi:hypothetical protein